MITAGREKTEISRRASTVLDAVSDVGGLYYPVLFFSIIVSYIFFKPIDDLSLYFAW
jgi:hypothetical protein